jgi:hypothetical protein
MEMVGKVGNCTAIANDARRFSGAPLPTNQPTP